jgi:hypothetical protein
MPDLVILRLISSVEEVSFARGIAIDPPLKRAIAVAVLGNPYSGRYVDDLTPLTALGESLAHTLGQRAIELLGGPGNVATYGKAALIGLHGELEHGAAVLHPRMGAALRKLIERATTMIPSVTKIGPAGALLDIPLHHVRDQWSFDHFDTASITVADAPAPDELLIAIAMSNRGRPLARTVKHEV